MSADNTVEIEVRVDDNSHEGFSRIDRAMSKISSVAGNVFNALTQGLAQAGSDAARFGSQLLMGAASAAALGAETTVATGGVNLLVGALVAVGGAAMAAVGGFFALAPAVSLVGGIAGAAISGIVGLASAIFTLKTALGGVGEAFSAYGKQAGGAGGSSAGAGQQAAAAARQIENAEYALSKAKERAKEASEAVTEAREKEIERLEDLDIALKGQVVSQKEAAQSLIEAKEMNRRAQESGSAWEKAQAANAVERAQYEYDQVTEKLGDLRKDKQKAAKDGVEGSDQVQDALKRERDAQDQVTQSAKALADAKRGIASASGGAAGGINAFNDAMSKLSPNAREFVLTLIQLSKRFDEIKRKVQDRFFDGMADAVEKLANKWFPALDRILVSMAGRLNGFAKTLLDALGGDKFIANIEKASKGFERMLDPIEDALPDLIEAFGNLAGESTPVLEEIGKIIGDIFQTFSDWINSAAESGDLQSFMENAADTLDQIYRIGKLVVGIVGEIIEILFPGSDAAASSLLDKVEGGLKNVSDWLKDEKNKQKIQDFFDKVGEFFQKLFDEYIPMVLDFAKGIWTLVAPTAAVVTAFGELVNMLEDNVGPVFDWVVGQAEDMVDWFRGLPDRMYGGLSGAWNGLRDGFRSALNWIIERWNGLSFSLPSFSFLGQSIGGGNFGTPNIPYLAHGGIGGGLAMVGERGRELVRLPQGSQVIPNGQTEAMMGSGGASELTVRYEGVSDPILQQIIEGLRFEIRRKGRGNPTQFLGGVAS